MFAHSLLQSLRNLPLAFVDVETTGASADYGHRVIELGIVRVEGGQTVGEYQQLLDPQRRITPGVTALTGISDVMVDGQPTFAEQLPHAMGLLQGAMIVGHNIRFDLSFLAMEFRRCRTTLLEALGEVPVLDTVRIVRRRFGRGGNGLQSLACRLGVAATTAHRALADAQTTLGVFEKMMEPVGGWDQSLCDVIAHQGGPMGLLPVTQRESPFPLELQEALELKRPVLMEYLDARQKRTQRKIQPLNIRRFKGELLLTAFCHLRGDQRTFKVDRVVQLIRIDPDDPCVPTSNAETLPDASSCDSEVKPLGAQPNPTEGLFAREASPPVVTETEAANEAGSPPAEAIPESVSIDQPVSVASEGGEDAPRNVQ